MGDEDEAGPQDYGADVLQCEGLALELAPEGDRLGGIGLDGFVEKRNVPPRSEFLTTTPLTLRSTARRFGRTFLFATQAALMARSMTCTAR